MRTEGDLIQVNNWLLPLSWIYGAGVNFRNHLFDMGILKQQRYDLPVIAVGNITVGGAGKTPHVEYLIRLLKDIVKTGVLSRGYKRKTKGYVLATQNTPMQDIGDEPCQMNRKFSNIYVAVDKNRNHGIKRLTTDQETNDVDVILLDDAFQHRYVHPGINILLVDYHRPIIYDKLLPAGRLREPVKGKNRADIVIVTKCPKDLKPMEFRVLTKTLNLFPYQELFFTCIDYAKPYLLFGENDQEETPQRNGNLGYFNGKNVLLVTGIASPEQMQNDIGPQCRTLTSLAFGDHHSFKSKDIQKIEETFLTIPEPRMMITTEKDAMRLQEREDLSNTVKDNLYVLPIKVKFMQNEEEKFNNKIISYVRKNSRNSILVKRKDDDKSKDSHHIGNRAGTISFRDN